MKKLLAVLLVMVMAFSALPVLAAEIDKDVLMSVKERVEIPEGLTEFSYSESTYDNVLRYDFTWHDADYNREVYVTSDSKGRIVGYSRYERNDYSGEKSLIGYSLSDARALTEEFVKRAYPEYFENENDCLKLNEEYTTSSYSGRYKSFSFRFERFSRGEVMTSNTVVVRVRATKEIIYVQNVAAALDEDVTFVQGEDKSIGKSEYTEKFPVELYYGSDYSGKEPVITLFYSIDKGYVSRFDNSVLVQKYFDRYAEYGAEDSVATESTLAGGNKNAQLTPEEIKALEENANLVKVKDVEAMLRKIEILKITDDMKLDRTNTNKYDDRYVVRFTLKSDEKTTNVTYNGETGEVTNINTYYMHDYANNKTGNIVMPKEDIESFVRTLSSNKLDETSVTYTEGESHGTMNAVRLVNNVKYPENSINVTYDGINNAVTRYSIAWDEDVSKFPKPEEAIGLEKAEDIIFNIEPLYNTFVKTEAGYVPSITIGNSVTINAITGEEIYKKADEKKAYTDISNHWAKNEINILWEHDIYLAGDCFNPDTAITQADMIRLFSACRDAGIIPIGWENDRIAEYGFNEGYVKTDDPDKLMTRREAFKAMCQILGYGEVAEFDIYKSSYTDMEPCGSAEILKAMGVLTGDTARPDDYLTRAEAAVMVYRYLSK